MPYDREQLIEDARATIPTSKDFSDKELFNILMIHHPEWQKLDWAESVKKEVESILQPPDFWDGIGVITKQVYSGITDWLPATIARSIRGGGNPLADLTSFAAITTMENLTGRKMGPGINLIDPVVQLNIDRIGNQVRDYVKKTSVSKTVDSWLDSYIKMNVKEGELYRDIPQQFKENEWINIPIFGKATYSDLESLGQNLGYSGAGMAATIAGSFMGSAFGGAALAAGFLFRASKDQFVEQVRDWMVDQLGETKGIATFNEYRSWLEQDIDLHAFWEAAPEALSNLLMVGIARVSTKAGLKVVEKIPVIKNFLDNKFMSLVTKVGAVGWKPIAMVGEELATETLTQYKQSAIEAKIFDRLIAEGKLPKDFKKMREKGLSFVEAYDEIKMVTLLNTMMLGGGTTALGKLAGVKKVEHDAEFKGRTEKQKIIKETEDFTGESDRQVITPVEPAVVPVEEPIAAEPGAGLDIYDKLTAGRKFDPTDSEVKAIDGATTAEKMYNYVQSQGKTAITEIMAMEGSKKSRVISLLGNQLLSINPELELREDNKFVDKRVLGAIVKEKPIAAEKVIPTEGVVGFGEGIGISEEAIIGESPATAAFLEETYNEIMGETQVAKEVEAAAYEKAEVTKVVDTSIENFENNRDYIRAQINQIRDEFKKAGKFEVAQEFVGDAKNAVNKAMQPKELTSLQKRIDDFKKKHKVAVPITVPKVEPAIPVPTKLAKEALVVSELSKHIKDKDALVLSDIEYSVTRNVNLDLKASFLKLNKMLDDIINAVNSGVPIKDRVSRQGDTDALSDPVLYVHHLMNGRIKSVNYLMNNTYIEFYSDTQKKSIRPKLEFVYKVGKVVEQKRDNINKEFGATPIGKQKEEEWIKKFKKIYKEKINQYNKANKVSTQWINDKKEKLNSVKDIDEFKKVLNEINYIYDPWLQKPAKPAVPVPVEIPSTEDAAPPLETKEQKQDRETPPAKGFDDGGVKFQEIGKEQPLAENNKEIAEQIIARINKLYPAITIEAVEYIYDKYGREVAGRAFRDIAQWSRRYATVATLAHEPWHIIMEAYIDDSLVQQGLNKIVKTRMVDFTPNHSTQHAHAYGLLIKNNKKLVAELKNKRDRLKASKAKSSLNPQEAYYKYTYPIQLYNEAYEAATDTGSAKSFFDQNGIPTAEFNKKYLQALAMELFTIEVSNYFAGRITDKTLYNRIRVWLQQFVLKLKKMFGLLTADDIVKIVGENYFQGRYVLSDNAMLNKEQFAEIDDIGIGEQTSAETGEGVITRAKHFFMRDLGIYVDGLDLYKFANLARVRKNPDRFIQSLRAYIYTRTGIKLRHIGNELVVVHPNGNIRKTNWNSFHNDQVKFYQRTNNMIERFDPKDSPNGKITTEMLITMRGGNIININEPQRPKKDGTVFKNMLGETIPSRFLMSFTDLEAQKGNIQRLIIQSYKEIYKRVLTRDPNKSFTRKIQSGDMEITSAWLRKISTMYATKFKNGELNNLISFFNVLGGDNSQIAFLFTPHKYENATQKDFEEYFNKEVADKKLLEKHSKNFTAWAKADSGSPAIYAQLIGYHEMWKSLLGDYYIHYTDKIGLAKVFKYIKLAITSRGTAVKNIGTSSFMIFDPNEVIMKIDGKEVNLIRDDGSYMFDGWQMTGGRYIKKQSEGNGQLSAILKTVISYLNPDKKSYVNQKMLSSVVFPGMQIYKDNKLIAEVRGQGKDTYWYDTVNKREFDHLVTNNEVKMATHIYKNKYEAHDLPEDAARILIHPGSSKKQAVFPLLAPDLLADIDFMENKDVKVFYNEVFKYYENLGAEYTGKFKELFANPNKLAEFVLTELQEGELPTELHRAANANPKALLLDHYQRHVLPMIVNKLFEDGLFKGRSGKGVGTSLYLKPGPGLDIKDESIIVAADNKTLFKMVGKASGYHTADAVNVWLEKNDFWVLVHRQPIQGGAKVQMRKIQAFQDGWHGDAVFLAENDVYHIHEADYDGDSVFIEKLSPELEKAWVNMQHSDLFQIRNKNFYDIFLQDKSETSLTSHKDVHSFTDDNNKSRNAQGLAVNAKTLLSILAYKEMEATMQDDSVITTHKLSDPVTMIDFPLDPDKLDENMRRNIENQGDEIYTKIKEIGESIGITKIISGGQIGADQFGLEVAQELGIETGGTAPPGFQTSIGQRKELLQGYGLIEGESDEKIYRKRTIKNVQDSDGTVLFGDENSPGSKLTKNTAINIGKPYIANPSSDLLKQWIVENNIKTLNVAGNRKINASAVKPILLEALSGEYYGDRHIPLNNITEGQEHEGLFLHTTKEHEFSNLFQFAVDDPKMRLLKNIPARNLNEYFLSRMFKMKNDSKLNISQHAKELRKIYALFNYSSLFRNENEYGKAMKVYEIKDESKKIYERQYDDAGKQLTTLQVGKSLLAELHIDASTIKSISVNNNISPREHLLMQVYKNFGNEQIYPSLQEGEFQLVHNYARDRLNEKYVFDLIKQMTAKEHDYAVTLVNDMNLEKQKIMELAELEENRIAAEQNERFPNYDYNTAFEPFLKKYIPLYEALTDAQQQYATLHYLNGAKTVNQYGVVKHSERVNYLLPIQLMHDKILSDYADYYQDGVIELRNDRLEFNKFVDRARKTFRTKMSKKGRKGVYC